MKAPERGPFGSGCSLLLLGALQVTGRPGDSLAGRERAGQVAGTTEELGWAEVWCADWISVNDDKKVMRTEHLRNHSADRIK